MFPRIGEYIEAPEPPRSSAALREALEAALQALAEILGLFEYPDLDRLRGELDGARAALANEEDRDLETLSARCAQTSRQAAALISAHHHAERRELASLILAIQDAVATLSGDTETFHAGVRQSTERFEKIASLNHILELKTRLTAEVHVLRSKTVEGQRAWQHSVEALGKRIAQLELQLHASRQESALDPLTHVANRGAFDRRCREWLNSGLLQFTLLIVDIDNFKQTNDRYGHPEGDRVLIAVADALQRSVRSSQDLVARLGGDEFAVLAINLTLRGAERLFARVAALLQESAAQHPPLPPVTLSGGAAEYSAGDTVNSLLQRADAGLYEAKRRGKNRIVSRERPLNRDL